MTAGRSVLGMLAPLVVRRGTRHVGYLPFASRASWKRLADIFFGGWPAALRTAPMAATPMNWAGYAARGARSAQRRRPGSSTES